MIVEVMAVGTEMLLGQIVNTNAAVIGARLAEHGFDHYRQTVVGDNLGRLTAAIAEAAMRCDALIITGGLGPTQDDLTREALGAAAGVEMLFDDEHAARLRDVWERRGRVMPESNLRQAQYPEGAVMIDNAKGTAPGLRMRVGECWVFALPGVPQEMEPMLDDAVVPFLVGHQVDDGGAIVSRLLRTWGESESRVAELLADLYAGSTNPTIAFLASDGEIKVRLTARAPSSAEAEALIAPVEEEVRGRLGRFVFGADADTVERIILDRARARAWSLATAESVTGGSVAAALTGVPGASNVFVGSIVSYAAEAKTALLGVDPKVIAARGQVSPEVAAAMADGAAKRLGADAVVSVTGSAGPEPLDLPPGTVVIGVLTPEDLRTRTLYLPGDRERVRVYATTAALHCLRLGLSGDWWRE
jgi:nicotinamide-nucleotide amidase